ncbi:Ig-like domain-containing protein [Pyxidicoccus trucidator]|uniref:Ig-like domain-containing protein n=1 Tax=Pyxidicoccus trucidator TaxID=2709662 RepID=UPI0013D9ABE5|nr:Ig-like domain-containing protein [Pyxidicoccus trucidator]
MRYPQIVALFACLFSWACIDLPEVQQVTETSDSGVPGGHAEDSGTSPDASVPDSGIPDSGVLDSGTPSLVVTLVTSQSITNGDVQVNAEVIGPAPDELELLVDGVAVATLAPPYELRWSTQSLEEGSHVLVVRATLGERRFTSESRTLEVDRTSPRLISQTPLTGSQNVPVRQTIQASFSEPLKPATVSAASVKLLSDAGVVAADVLLTPEGTLLTLRPVSLLPADTVVQVSLDGLADLAGNTLQALPQDWEWTVPGYLPLGEPLSASSTESSIVQTPSLRIDGAGQPVVAWSDGTNLEPFGIRVKRWNGTGWEQIGSVREVTAGHGSLFSALEVDGDGLPSVAWNEFSQATGMTFRAQRWNGEAWESLGTPGTLLRQQASADFIIFKGNEQGYLALAFRELYQGADQLLVGRWNGSSWGLLGGTLKVNSAWSVSSLQMEMDAAGNPIVTWSESNSGTIAAYMKRWNGGAWEAIPMPAQTYPGKLIIDDSGAPILDVPASNGTANSAQLRRWNGSSWVALGNPISVHPGATNSLAVALTFDAQGRLIALIAEPEMAGGATVFYLRRWNAGAWEPVGSPLRKTPGSTPFGATLLALDASGRPVLARAEYSESEPTRRRLYVYTPND